MSALDADHRAAAQPAPFVQVERAARERLLNCLLRETGPHEVAAGPARIALPATGQALLVDITRRSVTGHHTYGGAIALERADGTRTTPTQHELVAAILAELVAAGPAAVRPAAADPTVAALTARIADSVARSARYLARAAPPEPVDGDAHALTRHAEQTLRLGHPFHPTPKSAQGFDDDDLERYAPELGASFQLHWLAVSPSLLHERRVGPGDWVPAGVDRGDLPDGHGLLPAHPWQARHLLAQPAIAALVAERAIEPLGARGPMVYPTSSVRTVCAPRFASAWKLPLHVRITNFVRTTPIEHARRALDASAAIARSTGAAPAEGFDVLLERGYRTLDPVAVGDELAADATALLRANPFATDGHAPRVLASLLEHEPDGPPPPLVRCVRAAGGDALAWLRAYLELSLRPLLTLFARHGISLEAHVQNTLLHTEVGWPAHVWVRDMEGAAIARAPAAGHRRAGGAAPAAAHEHLPADSPALYDESEAWLRLRYHAVTNQLGHLVAVLGRHHPGGEAPLWALARAALRGWRDAEPYAGALRAAPSLPAKANLRSALADRGERPLYVAIPNPLHDR